MTRIFVVRHGETEGNKNRIYRGQWDLPHTPHGDEQVKIWRRAYAIPPPALEPEDERNPTKDPRYADLKPGEAPLTECLKDTVDRFLPLWHDEIAPAIKSGQKVLIAAHGNSLRALVKYLDNVSDDDIVGLNIPTGMPLVYELDADLKPIKNYYLGDPEAVKKAMEAVLSPNTVQYASLLHPTTLNRGGEPGVCRASVCGMDAAIKPPGKGSRRLAEKIPAPRRCGHPALK